MSGGNSEPVQQSFTGGNGPWINTGFDTHSVSANPQLTIEQQQKTVEQVRAFSSRAEAPLTTTAV